MTQLQVQAAPATSIPARGFATLLVHAEPGARAASRVKFAARLARELGAHLIGLGAETYEPIAVPDPIAGAAAADWMVLLQEQINDDLKAAEAGFRRDAAEAEVEWRVVQDYPGRALARVARAADLIIASPRGVAGSSHAADPADLVMRTGRPILVVPPGVLSLKGDTVVVAWKDTREARRAVADALPLLSRAKEVIVQGVCEDSAVEETAFQTEDVAASLRRHGVSARSAVSTSSLDGVAGELQRIAGQNQADLIVCGGYGHSRFQEWALGGVTDELINNPPCCVLMSH